MDNEDTKVEGEQAVDETKAPAPVAVTEPAKGKSIIDPKYRGKYKTPDWLAKLITDNASLTTVKPAVAAVGEEGKEGYKPAVAERTVIEGVDAVKVMDLAEMNGLDMAKFRTQHAANPHGFGGRIKMTARNMLQTVIKQRHGILVNATLVDGKWTGGTWVDAPSDWLHSKSAPATPSHNHDGSRIAAPAKVADPEPSKLIKADPAPGEEVDPASEAAEDPKPEGDAPAASAKAKRKK